MDFDRAYSLLLEHEGGYSKNPRDPGGETNFGISKRSYPKVDIPALTRITAGAIYKRDFWDAPGIGLLPPKIRFSVFDFAVNSGAKPAIILLQSILRVIPDGVIGPKTLAAAIAADSTTLVVSYSLERLIFMTSLPTWPAFGKGWTLRMIRNIKLAFLEGSNNGQ